jgi:hypothetical protein
MNIHKIRTEAEYRAALKEASTLMDSAPALETPEGKQLSVLVGLVQAYESTSVPVDGALVDRICSIVAGVEGLSVCRWGMLVWWPTKRRSNSPVADTTI